MVRKLHRKARRLKFLCLAIASTAPLLHAQDLRSVHEPAIPPTCTTLNATLTPASATSGDIEVRARNAGSDSTGLDTARIQQALNECPKGHAVELAPSAANTAFLTGPLVLRPGVTLLLDQGVTLYATRNPESYAITPGSCGTVNTDSGSDCKPLIAARNAPGSAIMGSGVIEGQGGATLIVDGKPSTKTWWDLANDARTAGHQQAPRLVEADTTDDFTVYRITLRNAPNAHLLFQHAAGLTVWAVTIDTPRSTRNTIGIDLAQAKNVTITQSFIRTGEDHIAIRAGDSPTANITVAHNHFYWGHGLTIGGETIGGVSGIRVDDLSLDGPDNGIRVTSSAAHGGLVEDVVYQDVCIRNAKAPILFDTAFSFPGKGIHELPVYDDITLRNVRLSGGGKVQFNGFDATHRIGVTLDGVLALDMLDKPAKPDLYRSQAIHTDLTFGPGPVNFVFIGDDSTVTGHETPGTLPTCAAKFIPFP
jgi:polygalacturonase